MWCVGSHLWMEVTGRVTSGLALPEQTDFVEPETHEEKSNKLRTSMMPVERHSLVPLSWVKQACQKKDDLNQSHTLQVMH